MRTVSFAAPLFALGLLGCDKGNASASADAGAHTAADASVAETFGVTLGGPFPPEKVVAALNPEHKPPYTGPKGTLRGMVRVEGDAPPETNLKFPERCRASSAAYGKIFRVGLDKALADAVVAVTQYGDRGFVSAADEAVKVKTTDCVPDKLTYTVTYGQRMEFYNLDSSGSYLPYLDGAGSRTIMVAVPKGAPINLYPGGPSPAHYMLREQLGSNLVANVFLLNYSTHAVTGLDGHYEIKNIPVGKVRVDVMLPVISKAEGREVDVHEGDNTLDFTLHFDAEKDMPKRAPAADAGAPSAPTSTASAAPSASAPPRPKTR